MKARVEARLAETSAQYRALSVVLHAGDLPDIALSAVRERLLTLKHIVTKLSRWKLQKEAAVLGGMWSLEISPSENTKDYAHPHAHVLLLVRADVHEGQVAARLKLLASRAGLSSATALVRGTYREQEGIADLCGYMLKGHAEATDEAPTSAHAWLRVEAMYRRRSHALFGLLKGSDDEGDEGDEGETETKTDETETEPPEHIKKWLWSAIRSTYVKVRNKSESRDDTLFNEMNVQERPGATLDDTIEQPATSAEELPVTRAEELPAGSVGELLQRAEERPATSFEERPATSAEELDELPATSFEERPATSAEELDELPATSLEELTAQS